MLASRRVETEVVDRFQHEAQPEDPRKYLKKPRSHAGDIWNKMKELGRIILRFIPTNGRTVI